MKVHIGTHREVGKRCIEWAMAEQLPEVELVDTFEECDIFISVMYDRLLSETEIRSKVACYNFHTGILPRYRGSGAYSWVIINGEEETGVTVHRIDPDIDHGPVLEIRRFPVLPDDTAESLFRKAEGAIFDLFRCYYTLMVCNEGIARPQDETKAHLYYRKELEAQRDLTRYVRAFTFEGKPKAFYRKRNGEVIELEY